MGPSAAMTASLEAYMELQKPQYHTPVILGIKHFKRELAENFPTLKKSSRNKLVRAFKKRAWMEFTAISRLKGTFPTHPVYGKEVKVTTVGMDVEHEIKVTNGKQQK